MFVVYFNEKFKNIMLLLFLVFIPFFAGLLCCLFGHINVWFPRWIALCGMSIVLVITIFLWKIEYFTLIDVSLNCSFPQWKLEYIYSWIPRFGINLHLALDGLSLLMVMLSAFLGCISILCSWCEIKKYQGYFYCNLLWIVGGSIGVFLSIDMFLFFFFWEITLIPMYFLISLWGHREFSRKSCIYVATKFFIYTQFSGLFMLISIITLVLINYKLNGIWSFNYQDLLHVKLSKNVEYLLMLGFFCAFAIKMPIVPLHSWMPDVHSKAPTSGAIDIVGVLLKTAVYGFFRFSLPLFPDSSKSFAFVAMFLGLLNIFYGAWMAFIQTDIKRLIAYSSISHMGFVLLAIYSVNQLSYQGAVIQMIAHSISMSGMFILCGQLYDRLHTRDMRLMGGLWNSVNLIPAFFICFSVAMLGLPGTGNFVGEITILFGSFQVAPIITTIAVFGIIFTSVYSLIAIQRVCYGVSIMKSCKSLKNMSFREKFIIIILLLCTFYLGIFPQCILNTSYTTMQDICFWMYKHD